MESAKTVMSLEQATCDFGFKMWFILSFVSAAVSVCHVDIFQLERICWAIFGYIVWRRTQVGVESAVLLMTSATIILLDIRHHSFEFCAKISFPSSCEECIELCLSLVPNIRIACWAYCVVSISQHTRRVRLITFPYSHNSILQILKLCENLQSQLSITFLNVTAKSSSLTSVDYNFVLSPLASLVRESIELPDNWLESD